MFNIDDYISSCKYSLDGNYMAIGDDAGRIVIFDVNHTGTLDYAWEVPINPLSSKLTVEGTTGKQILKLNPVWLDCSGWTEMALICQW